MCNWFMMCPAKPAFASWGLFCFVKPLAPLTGAVNKNSGTPSHSPPSQIAGSLRQLERSGPHMDWQSFWVALDNGYIAVSNPLSGEFIRIDAWDIVLVAMALIGTAGMFVQTVSSSQPTKSSGRYANVP